MKASKFLIGLKYSPNFVLKFLYDMDELGDIDFIAENFGKTAESFMYDYRRIIYDNFNN